MNSVQINSVHFHKKFFLNLFVSPIFLSLFILGCSNKPADQDVSLKTLQDAQNYTKEIVMAEVKAVNDQAQKRFNQVQKNLKQLEQLIQSTPTYEPQAGMTLDKLKEDISSFHSQKRDFLLNLVHQVSSLNNELISLKRTHADFIISWRDHCRSGVGFPIVLPEKPQLHSEEEELELSLMELIFKARQNRSFILGAQTITLMEKYSTDTIQQQYETSCLEAITLLEPSGLPPESLESPVEFSEFQTYIISLLEGTHHSFSQIMLESEKIEGQFYFYETPLKNIVTTLTAYLDQLAIQYLEEDANLWTELLTEAVSIMNEQTVRIIRKLLIQDTEACAMLSSPSFGANDRKNTAPLDSASNLSPIQRNFLNERVFHIRLDLQRFCTSLMSIKGLVQY